MNSTIALLALLTAYGVFRVTRKIIGQTGHLTDEDILEYKYRRRSLSESYQKRITNHIGRCEECRKRFTDMLMG